MEHNEDIMSLWGGGVYDIPHWIGGKVLNLIYVKVSLNSADTF